MAKRIYEFVCEDSHLTERFVDSECRQSTCTVCGKPSARIISTPMVSLDGTTGAFPGEAMKWERKRAEKVAQERKRAASYGE
jgi:hypothetical protein